MTRVRDIMTSDVSTISPDMTLREAVDVLSGRNMAGAPVVRGTKVVGVVSMADLLEFEATTSPQPSFREEQADWGESAEEESWEEGAAPPLYFIELWRESESDVAERMSSIEGPEWDFLADHSVGEVASRQLLSVSPDDDVRTAARRMADEDVHRVLVMNGNGLEGVLSASDIVSAVADGKI